MDIAKFTVEHEDNWRDARHRTTSLDVTTSDTGAQNYSATMIFEQKQIYDRIDWRYFCWIVWLQIVDGTGITLKILAPMAKGDAYQPSELGTYCYHGGVIELGVHHHRVGSAVGQQGEPYTTSFYLNMCAERKHGERARFLVEILWDERLENSI